MKRRTFVISIAIAVFALLFIGRFFYELSLRYDSSRESYEPQQFQGMVQNSAMEGSLSYRKNFASEKIVIEQARSQTQIVDQKYERIADLSAVTTAFDEDVRRIAELAGRSKAVIQRENSFGLEGSRSLSLTLGVVPEAFDATVKELRSIGELLSITVTKTDRTQDFKALEARRLSLEKTRDGLRALRPSGGNLSDLMNLETKILEIEGQIQELGVSLGDYSENNSFCTINVTLGERKPERLGLRIAGAAWDAFSWTILSYLGIAVSALAIAAAFALGSVAVSRIKAMAGTKPGAGTAS